MSFRILNLFRFLNVFHFKSFPGAVGRTPQRWAKIACWIAFLSPLPSVCWRLAMLAGVNTGFAEAARYRSNASGIVYVILLDAVQVGAAALSLGLCYSWGEKVPRWVPRLGGKIIHRRLAVALGGIGAFCLSFPLSNINNRYLPTSIHCSDISCGIAIKETLPISIFLALSTVNKVRYKFYRRGLFECSSPRSRRAHEFRSLY